MSSDNMGPLPLSMLTGKPPVDSKVFIAAINEYESFNMNLRGTHTDADRMFELLTVAGKIPVSNIRTAIDSECTADKLRGRLEWMVSGRGSKPISIWTYSGHGSRASNPNQPSGYSEIICGYDTQSNWPGQLRDEEIWKYLCRLPQEGRCLSIFDCCHAGTMYRTIPNEDITPRFQPLGAILPLGKDDTGTVAGVSYMKDEARPAGLPAYIHIDNELPGVQIAACDDPETSGETMFQDGNPNNLYWYGIFTSLLHETVLEYPNNTLVQTAIGIFEKIRARYGSVQQTPQWWCRESELDRPVFDFSDQLS